MSGPSSSPAGTRTVTNLYVVRAEWDADAAVWVASSDDVPGLVTEAETREALEAKLRTMIPELLAANGQAAVAATWTLEYPSR